uniref:Large ribosomal subunit protein bL19c n=1 Tax=Dipterosiphonia australica TaxID=2007208 RepID=A0A1Z1MLH7_9FLOR|nr:ribosomal protein L19 [Dipterosiphonia australica]ARW66908.1 ribosomal protein L19 [Dipterosiphonia australica]
MIRKFKKKSNLVQKIENQYINHNRPHIETGDSIKIQKVIQEGNKERVQISQGVVIAQNNSNINKTITVRKTVQNVGIEMIYLLHSPHILNIEVIKRSKVRKSKLYYLRNRSGKATRLKAKLI